MLRDRYPTWLASFRRVSANCQSLVAVYTAQMCGRFSQAYSWAEILAFSQPLTNGLGPGEGNMRPRYNIAPTTKVHMIVPHDGGRQLVAARWGLIPSWWSKKPTEVGATFNARVERVHESPMFRKAWKNSRCIIPASGFFEWTGPKSGRIPHYFSAADGRLLAFAGLWDRWMDRTVGHEVLSCTIIVREASSWMSAYHDRMPCMLSVSAFDAWLDGSAGKELLMQPPPALQEWIVDPQVNRTGAGDDDARTVAPLPS